MPAPRPAEQLRAHAAAVALVGALLLVAGLASGWSEAHATTTQQQTVERTRWNERAAFDYAVPVTRNSTQWPNGTILPMGMPAYYRTISPTFLVNFSWMPANATVERGLADATLALRVRAESPQGRAYWSFEEPLDARLFAAREPVRLAGLVDLDAMVAQIDRASREMPLGDGHLNLSVVARVAYALDAGGQADAATSEYALPLGFGDPRFTLPDPADARWDKPHATASVQSLVAQQGLEGALASPRVVGLALAGAALLGVALWARRTDPTRGLDPDEAAFRLELERHREFVTMARGAVDPARFPTPIVDTATLDDLVDAAADARARVLLDAASRVYYVVLPTLTYRYAGRALVTARPVRPPAVLPDPRNRRS